MAWLVGEGIIAYRTVKKTGAPPGPGQLLWSSGVFVLLALLAESENARPLAITLAWGFDIAAFLNLSNIGTAEMGTPTPILWPPPTLPPNVIFAGQQPAKPDGTQGSAKGGYVPNSGLYPGATFS